MVTSNSDLITNRTSVPAVMNNVASSGGRMRIATGSMTIADSAFDAAADQIRLCTLPSNAVIHEMYFICDDMDAGSQSEVDIGIYETGDADTPGTVIDIDCYADASQAFRAALTGATTNFRYGGGAGGLATTAGDALWQNAQLSADPGGHMEIVMTQKATVSDDDGANAFAFIISYTID